MNRDEGGSDRSPSVVLPTRLIISSQLPGDQLGYSTDSLSRCFTAYWQRESCLGSSVEAKSRDFPTAHSLTTVTSSSML